MNTIKHITPVEGNEVLFIEQLRKVGVAIKYDGDASFQVLLPTLDGRVLRIGVTDDDVAMIRGVWFDYYEGLAIEKKTI